MRSGSQPAQVFQVAEQGSLLAGNLGGATTVEAVVRSAGLVFALAGLGHLIAATPVDKFGAEHALVVRASLFAVLSLCLMRVGPSRLWRLVMRPDAISAYSASLVLIAWLMAVESMPAYSLSAVTSIALAATSEELVFRGALPQAIIHALPRQRSDRRRVWVAFVIAQVGFALTHIAIASGFHSVADSWSFFRLFAAGSFLASIRMLMGMPAAVALHATANLAVALHPPSTSRLPGSLIAALSALAVAHLTVSVVAHWREQRVVHHCTRTR